MKILHAADLHLDSPLRGLERYDGAPVDRLRGATRRALENLVQLALDEQVALVLIAGDLYDGDWQDYSTGLFFARQMARLAQAAIPVLLVAGNHDASNRMTRALRLPGNVVVFGHERPETRVLEELGVAVHGQSYGRGKVLEDLSAAYPAPLPGLLNIGLLHTCGEGHEGHEPYAPCRVDALARHGYDYWALGHVHHRMVLRADPWIVFSGNTQGRHARETGPKGCTMLTTAGGRIVSVEPRDLDVLRWESCAVDVAGVEDGEGVLDRIAAALAAEGERAEGKPVALRVSVTGACPAHWQLVADPERWVNEVRSAAAGARGAAIWVEKVELRTQAPALPGGAPVGGLGDVVRAIAEATLGAGEDEATWRAVLGDLVRKLPAELRDGELNLQSREVLARLVGEARDLVLERLLARGGSR